MKNNKKGFAISGILYPILILTVFLIVQVLILLGTRKAVLDQNRGQLIDALNSGNRVYTNEELTEIVTGLKTDTINSIYPVGSIYISTSNKNPKEILGLGTWSSFGAGRTIVGIDSSQTEFNTVEKTGGAKTVSHSHGSGAAQNGTLAAAIGSTNSNVAALGFKSFNPFGGMGSATYTVTGSGTGGGSFNHFTQVWGTTASTSVSTLQPYVTVYMWKRTA